MTEEERRGLRAHPSRETTDVYNAGVDTVSFAVRNSLAADWSLPSAHGKILEMPSVSGSSPASIPG